MSETRIAVIGLGYVGLPLALAFAEKFPGTIGFDVDQSKVDQLRQGIDFSGQALEAELKQTNLQLTTSAEELRGSNFFAVTVPTPVDHNNTPDLRCLEAASKTVGEVLMPGSTVVYESTVYPGVTEEFCGPILAEVSGLKQGIDFKLGYSPERINPGDTERTLQKIIKVVAGEDQQTLELLVSLYGSIIDAGLHQAPSIKVAEAAKVIENTQRDLNIALMNELAIIFDRLEIPSRDVLDAAATKWNFLRFTPGLVGGHCIGVDPYYLTTKAEQIGYIPQVILAGRRINDDMGKFVVEKAVKLMIHQGIRVKDAKVGVLGLAFKENVPDARNSRVPDIVAELEEFGVSPLVHDPLVPQEEASSAYGIELQDFAQLSDLDAMILAVPHQDYFSTSCASLLGCLKPNGVLVDVKSVINREELPAGIAYWSL